MLDTRLSDAEKYPLKIADLVVMNLNKDSAPEKVIWAAGADTIIDNLHNVAFNGDNFYRPMQLQGDWIDYTGSVMAIDPSGRGSDELGYAVVKFLNGYLYVTRCGGLQGGYGMATLETLANIAKTEKVNEIITEANFGDGMFDELLKPVLARIYPCALNKDTDGKGVRQTQQKERRIIDTLEPVMNQHRLIFDEKIIQHDYESTKDYPPEQALKYQLFHQMTRLTADRGALGHDDRLDALAIAVNYWVEYMARDAEIEIKERQDELVQEELNRLVQSAQNGHTVFTGHVPEEVDNCMF